MIPMRRRLLWIAAGAVAVISVALPVSYSYAGSSHNQVTGNATLGQFGNPTVHVNANQNNPGLKGSFTITYPDGTAVSGDPTCLTIDGGVAYITGKITSSSGPRSNPLAWLPGNYLVIGVDDTGTAGPGQLNFSPGFATDPGCGPNGAATPVFSVVDGGYRVVSS
jgi:hypothetical protein